jgi:hypothetical protein
VAAVAVEAMEAGLFPLTAETVVKRRQSVDIVQQLGG